LFHCCPLAGQTEDLSQKSVEPLTPGLDSQVTWFVGSPKRVATLGMALEPWKKNTTTK